MPPLTAPPTDPEPSRARHASADVERLTALWKLSVQAGLTDPERIRAMLHMAAEVLTMDLVVLGEFGEHYTVRYVADPLGVFPEGTVMMVETVLCHDVFLSREPAHITDLSQHPRYADHPVVTRLGLRAYSGLPVSVGDESRWVLAFLRRDCEAPPDAVDVAYMGLIADWLGNALFQSSQKDLLQRIALTDPLTGLPNRRAAEERLHMERARAPRDGHGFALALVDLDHFKTVNDRYGHAVGDEVLKAVARRFEAGLREGDWVARWGGEEFLFVLHGSSVEEAANILERLASQARATPVQTSIGALSLSFSGGVAAFDPRNTEILPMLEEIDHALYRAKSNGRDQISRVAQTAMPWNGSLLRQALAEGRLRQASQVIVDLQSGQAIADEALARIETANGRNHRGQGFCRGGGGPRLDDRNRPPAYPQRDAALRRADGRWRGDRFRPFRECVAAVPGASRSGRGNARKCHELLPDLRGGAGAGQAHRAGIDRASAHRQPRQVARRPAALHRFWFPAGAG